MKIKKVKINEVVLDGEEVQQLWRLLKNECEKSEVADATTYAMYQQLKEWFES